MYIVLWEYVVRSGHEAEFEKIYGANGDWVQLFEQGEGYLGTDLVRDPNTLLHYITIDHWISFKAYDVFHKKHRAAYRALDARCQALTEDEKLIGAGYIYSPT
jgi:heme-degrading monooxygenase HmoA